MLRGSVRLLVRQHHGFAAQLKLRLFNSRREHGASNTTRTTAATPDVAGKLAQATQALADALHNINAQFEALHAKIDRIVAAVDDGDLQAGSGRSRRCARSWPSAEKSNHDLKAQAQQARRKTLSPLVTTLLAKEGVEGDALIETPVVEKALSGLSIEQRIAVKAELARAGILA